MTLINNIILPGSKVIQRSYTGVSPLRKRLKTSWAPGPGRQGSYVAGDWTQVKGTTNQETWGQQVVSHTSGRRLHRMLRGRRALLPTSRRPSCPIASVVMKTWGNEHAALMISRWIHQMSRAADLRLYCLYCLYCLCT